MTKRISHIVLICTLLISMFNGKCVADWASHLTESINNHVQTIIQGVNDDIDRTLKYSVRPAIEAAHRAVENIPRDAHGQIINTSGSTIILNGNGLSRSVISGHTKDGEPFTRDITERHDGSTLYHYETYYNPRTNTTVRTCWKLDHSKPGAIPEIIQDC